MQSTFKDFIAKSAQLNSALEITPNWLSEHAIKGLIFDFDGVLGPDCSISPLDKYSKLLHELSEITPVAIYSNADLKKRELFCKKHFPKIHWVSTPPKKPNPKPLIDLSKKWNAPLNELAMVDDRIYTGGLAAYRAQCQFIFIKQPESCFFSAPIHNLIFKIIRGVEPLLLACSSK